MALEILFVSKIYRILRKHRSLDGSQFAERFLGTHYGNHEERSCFYPQTSVTYTALPHAYTRSPLIQSMGADLYAENEMLRRELHSMNDKLNYVVDSIRTFWRPELMKESEQRKDEALRINALQKKLYQQAVGYISSLPAIHSKRSILDRNSDYKKRVREARTRHNPIVNRIRPCRCGKRAQDSTEANARTKGFYR